MFGINKEQQDESISSMKIELVEPVARKYRNEERVLSCQKNGRLVFGEVGLKRLNVVLDDYVLMGNVGNKWYIAKRPAGTFRGYQIINQKGKNSLTVYIQSQSLLKVEVGEYGLGEAVDQDGVAFHELIRRG
jgi:hypothetical protein